MGSLWRRPAGLTILLAGPQRPMTPATAMPNLCLRCGSCSRRGHSGHCQAPGWSMRLLETSTAWWMARSDAIVQGDTPERARATAVLRHFDGCGLSGASAQCASLFLIKSVVFQMCTLPLDMPCGGLLLKESERGSCL